MKVKEIFIEKLKSSGYQGVIEEDTTKFFEFLTIIEEDREAVFRHMYGEKYIQDRGKKAIKEWRYRLTEAEMDVRNGHIPGTMYYLLTQIKTGQIKL